VGQPILAAAGFQPAPPRFFMKFRGPQAAPPAASSISCRK